MIPHKAAGSAKTRLGSQPVISTCIGMNLYRYVGNASTGATDPSGLEEHCGVVAPWDPRASWNPVDTFNLWFMSGGGKQAGDFAFGGIGYHQSRLNPGTPEQRQKWEYRAGIAAGTVVGGSLAIRLWPVVAAMGKEAVLVGTLTGTQIQALITSSGDRVVTLFTRLAQSPATDRLLYTATNPSLCNQIRHATEKTQLFVGRIPADLFHRLYYEGFIKVEYTQMGKVIDRAYVISAEAMPILHKYFEQSGGNGLP